MKINRLSLFPRAFLSGVAVLFSVFSANAQMPVLKACAPSFMPTYGTPCSNAGTNATRLQSVVTTGGIVNFNNSNTNCGNTSTSYSDYTTETFFVRQEAGKSFDVATTFNTGSTSPYRSAIERIYIDWNRDGYFNGPDELNDPTVDHFHPNGSGTISQTVKVPGHAKNGVTRMRIINSSVGNIYDINATQCGGSIPFASGEAEDYRIEVVNPCLPPNVISIANIDFKSGDISWTPKENAEFYEYLITPVDIIPDDTIVGFSFTTTPGVEVDTFKCDTKYYVLVRLICDTANKIGAKYWDKSAWKRDSFTTQPCCYDPQLTVDMISSTTARVSWSPVATAVGYEYAVSTTTDPPQKGTYTTATNIILQGLASRTTFFVHVRTRCSPTPLSDWSKSGFKTLGPTSVSSMSETSLFVMDAYPNPMHDQLNVQFNGKLGSSAKLTIIDLTGKVVYKSPVYTDKVAIDASNLASGIYIVKYSDDLHNQVMRVTKK